MASTDNTMSSYDDICRETNSITSKALKEHFKAITRNLEKFQLENDGYKLWHLAEKYYILKTSNSLLIWKTLCNVFVSIIREDNEELVKYGICLQDCIQ